MGPSGNSILKAAVLILVVLAGITCGGSGGGGGSPTQPPGGNATNVTFTQNGVEGSDTISMRGQTSGTTLTVNIRANDVNDLYGVAFDIDYPSFLSYQSASEGGFLNADGIDTDLQVANVNGVVIVGLTRLGNFSGRNGSGTLLSLVFRANSRGGANLGFQNRSAFRSELRQIPLTWEGGAVNAN